jgi:mannose-6-phosphate isomerase-like protein (cupin superfamily)
MAVRQSFAVESMEKFSIAEAIDRHLTSNTDYTRLIEKPAFDVGFYRPIRYDKQTPHSRDELYVVAEGSGTFVCGGETTPFKEGDLFFVPAGVAHCFKDFSYDFATWVIFFGGHNAASGSNNDCP